MRILILNWRCPQNPKAGGAETVTHAIARRLVALGHSVEWFSSSFRGAPKEEDLDGIHIVRAGSQSTVHWRAFRHYRGSLSGRFDLVIDEINTMPFLTPVWAGIPTLTLIFQLAREVWWYESKFPLSAIGYALEPLYLQPYHRRPAVTISESTEADLRRLGFKDTITVISIGVEPVEVQGTVKCSPPIFLYVGRLAPSKRVEHIIRAFGIFLQAGGIGQLVLAGTGDANYVGSLRSLVGRLALNRSVQFLGRISSAEKQQRMAEARLLVMASVREGWGLVITEANALGTPAIVYDVPGLRDAVRHLRTGLVVSPSPHSLAEGMERLVRDTALYMELSREAIRWSKEFSFDKAAAAVNNLITEAVARPNGVLGNA